MRRQMQASVRAGEGTQRIAERLLDIGDPKVELPKHVRDLRDAARKAIERGDANLYEKAVERWRGRIEDLGEGAQQRAGPRSIRSATQQLVKDLRKAGADQVDNVVDRWVVERARHQARVVAQTEVPGGHRDVYQRSMAGQEYVVGFRWVLSPRHPRPDVCDVLASQDLDGLGPGGYKADSVPSTPHPHDLCSLVAIMDTDHFARKRAKVQGKKEPPKRYESGKREDGQAWLRQKPEKFQRELLGPTRFKLFKQGRRVIDKLGNPLPVHKLTGQPKPKRRAGEVVKAKGAIKRDRRNQVIPFPKVK